MIRDAEATFSEDQAITSTGDTNSTNVYDLGMTKNIGPGQPIEVEIQTTEAVTSGGSATLEIKLVMSAATNLGTPTVLATTTDLAKTAFTLGKKWTFKVDVPEGTTPLQYLGIIYTVSTATLTAGKFSAAIMSPQGHQRSETYVGTL